MQRLPDARVCAHLLACQVLRTLCYLDAQIPLVKPAWLLPHGGLPIWKRLGEHARSTAGVRALCRASHSGGSRAAACCCMYMQVRSSQDESPRIYFNTSMAPDVSSALEIGAVCKDPFVGLRARSCQWTLAHKLQYDLGCRPLLSAKFEPRRCGKFSGRHSMGARGVTLGPGARVPGNITPLDTYREVRRHDHCR
jgi:hypothetical protein